MIHRDLATRNCLICKYGIIKISDFGLSLSAKDQAPSIRKEKVKEYLISSFKFYFNQFLFQWLENSLMLISKRHMLTKEWLTIIALGER